MCIVKYSDYFFFLEDKGWSGEVQLIKPMSFLGATYKSMGEG